MSWMISSEPNTYRKSCLAKLIAVVPSRNNSHPLIIIFSFRRQTIIYLFVPVLFRTYYFYSTAVTNIQSDSISLTNDKMIKFDFTNFRRKTHSDPEMKFLFSLRLIFQKASEYYCLKPSRIF